MFNNSNSNCAVDSTTGFKITSTAANSPTTHLPENDVNNQILTWFNQQTIPELNRISSAQDRILSIYGKGDRFAAAFYVQSDQRLFICPEYGEQPPIYSTCQAILNSLTPNVCLVNNNIDAAFRSFVSAWANLDYGQPYHDDLDSDMANNHSTTSRSTVKPEPSETNGDNSAEKRENESERRSDAGELILFCTHNYYKIENGKNTLLACNFPAMQKKSMDDMERYLQSMINFNDIFLMKAITALLQHLQNIRLKTNPADGFRSLVIRSIETHFKYKHLFMDSYTYESLEIFTHDYHPATMKYGKTSRSGENLFGIFNICRSWIGKKEMRRAFLSPQTDRAVLNNRLDVVEYFYENLDSELVKSVRRSLTQISPVDTFLKSMATFKTKGNQWIKFSNTLKSVSFISEMLDHSSRNFPLFTEISTFALNPDFGDLFKLLHSFLDLEQTKKRGEFVPLPGICQNLDSVREKAVRLESMKEKILKQEECRLRSDIEKIELVHINNCGFRLKLLPIFNSRIDLQPDLIFCSEFQGNGYEYYRCSSVDQLTVEFDDLPAQLHTCEMVVMLDLIEKMLPKLALIKNNLHLFGKLETLISFAEVAKLNNYVRPKFNNLFHIEIVGGRHPVLEHYKKTTVVSNDYQGRPGYPLIITGTNCCGKSVYLKQNCLILFLAHLGSFVPATSCTIGKVSKMFTKIYTNDSLSTNMGSFCFELNKILDIFKYADQESFVAVDELGRTTNPKCGNNFLITVLRNFLFDLSKSPYLTVLTHWYKIVNVLDHKNVTYNTFEITQFQDTIQYLYKLKDGFVDDSTVFTVIGNLLKNSKTYQRMEQLLVDFRSGKTLLLKCTTETEMEAKKIFLVVQSYRKKFGN